jgi:hypothetical protein
MQIMGRYKHIIRQAVRFESGGSDAEETSHWQKRWNEEYNTFYDTSSITCYVIQRECKTEIKWIVEFITNSYGLHPTSCQGNVFADPYCLVCHSNPTYIHDLDLVWYKSFQAMSLEFVNNSDYSKHGYLFLQRHIGINIPWKE